MLPQSTQSRYLTIGLATAGVAAGALLCYRAYHSSGSRRLATSLVRQSVKGGLGSVGCRRPVRKRAWLTGLPCRRASWAPDRGARLLPARAPGRCGGDAARAHCARRVACLPARLRLRSRHALRGTPPLQTPTGGWRTPTRTRPGPLSRRRTSSRRACSSAATRASNSRTSSGPCTTTKSLAAPTSAAAGTAWPATAALHPQHAVRRETCSPRRYYYTHNTGLQAQSVLFSQSSLDSEPVLLLDPNTLSSDGTVRTRRPSPVSRRRLCCTATAAAAAEPAVCAGELPVACWRCHPGCA